MREAWITYTSPNFTSQSHQSCLALYRRPCSAPDTQEMFNKCLFHQKLLNEFLESLCVPLVHQSCQMWRREGGRKRRGEEGRGEEGMVGEEKRLALLNVRKFIGQLKKFAKRQMEKIWTISQETSAHLKCESEGDESLFHWWKWLDSLWWHLSSAQRIRLLCFLERPKEGMHPFPRGSNSRKFQSYGLLYFP